MREIGLSVGSGRSADVYEYGEGWVLRRYRQARDTAREVAAMEHARSHGYPAPAAEALSETDIVMERVTGRTMLDDLGRRPWLVPTHAGTLAELHTRLHVIEAPGWLPAPLGEGTSLLHLDLHPENVILTGSGPVVIDWPNAARGPGAADVAHTSIVVACSLPPTTLYRRALAVAGRRLFLELFLRRFDRGAIDDALAAAGAYRLANRSLPERELDAIERMTRASRASRSARGS
jgi:aminoglycoside phosphotransferase (APT) family kinase protein